MARDHGEEHYLWLTKEEALGLLDMVLMCPHDLSPEQHTAVVKLGNFCRRFLSEQEETKYKAVPPESPIVPAA